MRRPGGGDKDSTGWGRAQVRRPRRWWLPALAVCRRDRAGDEVRGEKHLTAGVLGPEDAQPDEGECAGVVTESALDVGLDRGQQVLVVVFPGVDGRPAKRLGHRDPGGPDRRGPGRSTPAWTSRGRTAGTAHAPRSPLNGRTVGTAGPLAADLVDTAPVGRRRMSRSTLKPLSRGAGGWAAVDRETAPRVGELVVHGLGRRGQPTG